MVFPYGIFNVFMFPVYLHIIISSLTDITLLLTTISISIYNITFYGVVRCFSLPYYKVTKTLKTAQKRKVCSKVKVRVNIDNRLKERLETMKKSGANKAATRAINTSMRSTAAEAAKIISQDYNIKSSDIKKIIKFKFAKGADISGLLTAKSRPVSLLMYKARQIRKGLSVAVRRGARKVIESGFVAKMRSGYNSTWKRVGKKRLPIKEQLGPTIPFLMNSDEYADSLQQYAKDNLVKNLKREINYELNKKGTP